LLAAATAAAHASLLHLHLHLLLCCCVPLSSFKVEVNVGIAVTEGVEGIAAVESPVGHAGVGDGQGEQHLVLAQVLALVTDP